MSDENTESFLAAGPVTDEMLEDAWRKSEARYEAMTPVEKDSMRIMQKLGWVSAEMFPDPMDNELYSSSRLEWFKSLVAEAAEDRYLETDHPWGLDIRSLTEADRHQFQLNIQDKTRRYTAGLAAQS
jgi:hypothetical protein